MLNYLHYEILTQIENFIGSLGTFDFIHNYKDTAIILLLDNLHFYLFFKVEKIGGLFIIFFAHTN